MRDGFAMFDGAQVGGFAVEPIIDIRQRFSSVDGNDTVFEAEIKIEEVIIGFAGGFRNIYEEFLVAGNQDAVFVLPRCGGERFEGGEFLLAINVGLAGHMLRIKAKTVVIADLVGFQGFQLHHINRLIASSVSWSVNKEIVNKGYVASAVTADRMIGAEGIMQGDQRTGQFINTAVGASLVIDNVTDKIVGTARGGLG